MDFGTLTELAWTSFSRISSGRTGIGGERRVIVEPSEQDMCIEKQIHSSPTPEASAISEVNSSKSKNGSVPYSISV